MNTKDFQYTFYGSKADAGEITAFIEQVFAANEKAEAAGKRKNPICIWGKHGIGKTELVQQYALDRGYQLAYIAPAQFEEMGDLIGMPRIVDGQTQFAPPAWVPQSTGPGILLIDDINRADDRILRGLMQLLQHFQLASWTLPKLWQIVLTANPEGGDYSLTPMDDAMITRMLHITMVFNAQSWAAWAMHYGMDERGIDFVLSHPNIMEDIRTTPRTLVQFFENIQVIDNWEKQKKWIKQLGEASLDASTVVAFLAFIEQKWHQLPSSDQILETKDFQREVELPLQSFLMQDVFRVDLFSAICTRFAQTLTLRKTPLSPLHLTNIKTFIQMDFFPKDLRFAFVRDLSKNKQKSIMELLTDPALGKLLLA